LVGCAGSETCAPLTGVSVDGIDVVGTDDEGRVTELGDPGTEVTVEGSLVDATVS
jgi:hypothetical protein